MKTKSSKGWAEIGGKRCYYRSTWERSVARILQYMKEQGDIYDWQYEPVTFWFEKIRRGVTNYKPDFRVIVDKTKTYFIEVKGRMDQKSRTKLNRMKKYYPRIEVRLIDKKKYKQLMKAFSEVIGGLEI